MRRDGAVGVGVLLVACLSTVVIGVWARAMSAPAVVDRDFGVAEPGAEPSLGDRLVLLGWVSGGVVLAMAVLMVGLHVARRPRLRRGVGRRGRHR